MAIWTHHLKSIGFSDYVGPHYTGKAIKVGAGIQAFEAYRAADKIGLAIVGGECPTVGLAGGYTQGGGHSALASRYGLAADQALEWEVMDGTGKLLRASRSQNPDLYWALSGGGGGSYGVVWSLTAKAHKDVLVSGANLTFTNEGISQDTFYAGIAAYHALLAPIINAGAMSISFFTNDSFMISPLTAPGISKADLARLLQPFLSNLQKLGIKYTHTIRQFSGYLPQLTAMETHIQVGVAQYGCRLIPRSVIEKNNDGLMAAFRKIVEDGASVTTISLNVSVAVAGDVYNAVLPAWRETLLDVVVTT